MLDGLIGVVVPGRMNGLFPNSLLIDYGKTRRATETRDGKNTNWSQG